MDEKILFQIALKYVDKNYSYENLKEGDDLYNASNEEKEKCLSYYDDIQEQGTEWAGEKLKLLSKKEVKVMTSEERHQIAMFDKIEKALSERPFDDKELDFILKAIKNSRSYVVVFS